MKKLHCIDCDKDHQGVKPRPPAPDRCLPCSNLHYLKQLLIKRDHHIATLESEIYRLNEQVKRITGKRATLEAENAELRGALSSLAEAELEYRTWHDTRGSGDINTGGWWDRMRKRGDKARELLGKPPAPVSREVVGPQCRTLHCRFGQIMWEHLPGCLMDLKARKREKEK